MATLKDLFNFTGGYFQPISATSGDARPKMEVRTASVSLDTTTANINVTGNISDFELDSKSNQSAIHPNPMETEAQALLIIIYSFITILSVAGNTVAITVFAIGRRSKSDLRIFLINLAIADLIQAIFCMPFSFTNAMLDTWIFSAPMCPIVLFMQVFSVTASVLTNMAIGIDRFIVVVFPLKSMSTKYRSKIIIISIWIVALLLAGVELWVGRVTKATEFSTKADCGEDWANNEDKQVFTLFVLTFTYLIPFIILTITYTIIARKLWTRTSPGNRDETRDAAQLKSKRKVVKMLIIILALFGVCWLPLQVFFLVLDYNPPQISMRALTIIYFCVHILAMSNSFQNPIIYGFMNHQFRADLCDIASKWFPCCANLRCVLKGKGNATVKYPSQYTRSSNNNQNSDSDSLHTGTPIKRVSRGQCRTDKLSRSDGATKPLMNGHAHKTEELSV